MAYKGRRVKKKALHKNPLFWAAVAAAVLILVLVLWVVSALSGLDVHIRKPDPGQPGG